MSIASPTDITGCQLWLDASQMSLADGVEVATWADLSGNARDWVQSVPGTRPLCKTGILNGLRVVRFNGADDVLDGPNFLTGFTAAEIFILVKVDADPPAGVAQSGLWSFGNSGDSVHFPYTSGVVYDDFGSTVRKDTGDPTLSLSSAFRLYNVSTASGAWTSRVDGTQHFTTATNTVGWSTAPRLGSSSDNTKFLDGDIAEIALYNAVLSGGDRTDFQDYITAKWFAAAGGHPATKRTGGVRFGVGFCQGVQGMGGW
jgi:hypothetical protein